MSHGAGVEGAFVARALCGPYKKEVIGPGNGPNGEIVCLSRSTQ
jgi:hypothetical protein